MDPTGPLRGQSRVLGPHVAQRLLLLLALLGLDGKVSEELLLSLLPMPLSPFLFLLTSSQQQLLLLYKSRQLLSRALDPRFSLCPKFRYFDEVTAWGRDWTQSRGYPLGISKWGIRLKSVNVLGNGGPIFNFTTPCSNKSRLVPTYASFKHSIPNQMIHGHKLTPPPGYHKGV